MNFNDSETKTNLMRAFAGESQARNRYAIAASEAKNQKLYVIEAIFNFTAGQEKEHAEIFYNLLKNAAGGSIKINGDYPVDISGSVAQLLRFAQKNEYAESDSVYKSFGDTAEKEGFSEIAQIFRSIANIEKLHGERFNAFAALLENDKLFVSDIECSWMCLNCGNVISAKEVPQKCPVCGHDRGYFIRLTLAPYEPSGCKLD